ncbi:MAG TPA: DNA-binding protein [Clostridiaceae bacterium]|nr:DNA-binding protein [Clostridiaceae bacterium]
MAKSFYNIDELPMTLNSDDVAAALNISRAGAYNLMNQKEFPALRIGKRIVVPKQAFIRWIEDNTGKHVVI